MWRIVMSALLLAGCVQLPPTPQDIQAKRFEAVPDRSVIYIVRTPVDSFEASPLALDDHAQIQLWAGTYYRWEVPPGTHRIAGVGRANEVVTLTTAPGQVYFLEHTVRGTRRSGPQITALRQVNEGYGRSLVQRAQHL